MPTLGAALDFAKLEGRNFRAHILSAAPSSPVTGQLYYDSTANTLYYYNGTAWIGAAGAPPDATVSTKGVVQLAGDLGGGGTAAAPVIANGAVTGAKIAASTITDANVASANKDGAAATPSLRTLGAGTAQAMPGNATPGGPPTGAAGGDLAGSTYPNPVIAPLAVTDAKVAAANKDGAVGTPSMRTLGGGPLQALSGTTRLDQLAQPGASINMNGWTFTNLASPSSTNDAASKGYVDGVASGLDAKQSVKASSTGNLTLSGTQTVDGIALTNGDRCLVKNQTDPTTNGIYVVSGGAWARALDNDNWLEFPGAFTWVEQGTANADTGWICTVDQGGTLGSTPITWTQFSGAAMITAGAGLTKSGNTLSANPDGSTIDAAGAGASLEVRAGGIGGTQLANGAVDLTTKVTNTLPLGSGGTGQTTAKAARETGLGAAGYYNNNATHGAGTTITITQATHGLRSSRAILVQVQDNTTGNVEIPDINVAANGDVTVTYSAAVGANSKLVTLVG